jgi:dATP pyrophosphohydrolase
MKKRKVQIVIYFAPQDAEKQFLLLRTNNSRGFFWQNVTGGVEEFESFKEGAIREVKEETGIEETHIQKITDLELDFEFIDQWGNDVLEKVFCFKISKKSDIVIDPSEHDQYEWSSAFSYIQSLIKFPSNFSSIKKVMELL